MAWAYEIRDSNNTYTTEAERLQHTGNMPGSGLFTVHTTEDSSTPWQ
jgi:hypothetical protein